MAEKSKWYESLWKLICALAIIFGLIASVLQIIGAVDFWVVLIIPLHNFLTSSVPVYSFVLFLIGVIVLLLIVLKYKRLEENILDSEYARRIALLCITPTTTEDLRQKYNYWQRQNSNVVDFTGFDGYMKKLETQGYLKYISGKWEVTQKVLDYIKKYHGDLFALLGQMGDKDRKSDRERQDRRFGFKILTQPNITAK